MVSSKGNIEISNVSVVIVRTGDVNIVDNSVRKFLQSLLNIQYKVRKILRIIEKNDGLCGEGFIQSAFEGESERSTIQTICGVEGVGMGLEIDILNLVLGWIC